MKFFIYISLFTLLTIDIYCQATFDRFRTPSYKVVHLIGGTSNSDSAIIEVADFAKLPAMKDITISLRVTGNDSSQIMIYKNHRLFQSFSLPFIFYMVENECFVADLDNNKRPDIKFTIDGSGAGLAGELAYKIYLFNYGSKFKLLSFFDFSHEKEFDINGDGVFEILGCDHIQQDGHSYWAYNAYDFQNGKLRNISKSIGYPLWTKHLNSSNNILPKKISYKQRLTAFKDLPDETLIK